MKKNKNMIKVVVEVPNDINSQEKLEAYLKKMGCEELNAKIDRFVYCKSDWKK